MSERRRRWAAGRTEAALWLAYFLNSGFPQGRISTAVHLLCTARSLTLEAEEGVPERVGLEQRSRCSASWAHHGQASCL